MRKTKILSLSMLCSVFLSFATLLTPSYLMPLIYNPQNTMLKHFSFHPHVPFLTSHWYKYTWKLFFRSLFHPVSHNLYWSTLPAIHTGKFYIDTIRILPEEKVMFHTHSGFMRVRSFIKFLFKIFNKKKIISGGIKGIKPKAWQV